MMRPPYNQAHKGMVGRLPPLDQPLPEHQGLHLDQELLTAGNLLLIIVLSLGGRDLLHRLALVRQKGRCYPADGWLSAAVGVYRRAS